MVRRWVFRTKDIMVEFTDDVLRSDLEQPFAGKDRVPVVIGQPIKEVHKGDQIPLVLPLLGSVNRVQHKEGARLKFVCWSRRQTESECVAVGSLFWNPIQFMLTALPPFRS